MTANSGSLLANAELGRFEQAVGALIRAVETSPNKAAGLLGAAFEELTSSELSVDEIDRRARRIVSELPSDSAVRRDVAGAARRSTPEIRAAVVAGLPPQWQRAVYVDVATSPHSQDRATGAASASALAGIGERAMESQDEPEGDLRTVWLLGARDEVEANAQFLSGRGFDTIRVSSASQLPDIQREGCCGVVVHRGWWQEFASREAKMEFVRSQLELSSIPYYRIDAGELDDEGARLLDATLGEYDSATRSRVQLGEGSALTSTDVRQLEVVATLLESADQAGVTLEGLTDQERRLLATAIALFEIDERGGGGPPEALSMLPLMEGRSGARVFRVRSTDRRAVYVAKLDDVQRLREEHLRARSVAPESEPVRMAFYSLAGSAVLLQRLFADLDDPLEGAPSLRERLESRSAWERGARVEPEPNLDDLARGVDRLVKVIREVRRPASGDLGCNCWIKCEPLAQLADLGVRWRIEGDSGDFDPAELLPWVEAKVAELAGESMVHGDLHVGNVLMLDDRTPRLIDFALAGTGHPCFDFVRFSSAMAFSCIRPVQNEERLRAFFVRAHINGASAEVLCSEFEDLVSASAARLAAQALSLCRTGALEGVDSGDAEAHYLAMVYLTAAQSLTMGTFQGAVARAALGALQPTLVRLAQ